MEISKQASFHVAMVPTPGMGHLIPLVELAKRIVEQHHNFEVTIIVLHDGSPMKHQIQLLQALPKSISSIFLPSVSFHDLSAENVRIESRIILTLTRSLPALKRSLQALLDSTRLVALVVDLFGIEAIDGFKELGLTPYIFFPTNAMMLQLMFHVPMLDQMFSCEYRDLHEPIKLPGCEPFYGRDMADPLKDKKDVASQGIIRLCKRYPQAAGIMVNSFMGLEHDAFKALMEGDYSISGLTPPPVYPVGPLTQRITLINNNESNDCLRWLDKQHNGSVLYVCFGSGGTLSHQQLNELAMGLEMSGQKFLWVVKSPDEKAANATYFDVESTQNPLSFLPDGFLERTKGVGLVIPYWAPQIDILKHASTGGFVTHCGWNSTLEAIVCGVPLIAWPLYAEQKMNAVLLTEGLKVASRVKENEKGVVERDNIAQFVKGVIEGEEGKLLRSRMRKLKEASEMALSSDGSSTKSLVKVVEIWRKNQKK